MLLSQGYFPTSTELSCRRFALFRNLSPPTVNGDGGGAIPKTFKTIVYTSLIYILFQISLQQGRFFSLQLTVA